MTDDDKYILTTLLKGVRGLLNNAEKLEIENLPLESSGIIADLLYRDSANNTFAIDIIDTLIQDVREKTKQEILDRFILLERILTTLYERSK